MYKNLQFNRRDRHFSSISKHIFNRESKRKDTFDYLGFIYNVRRVSKLPACKKRKIRFIVIFLCGLCIVLYSSLQYHSITVSKSINEYLFRHLYLYQRLANSAVNNLFIYSFIQNIFDGPRQKYFAPPINDQSSTIFTIIS